MKLKYTAFFILTVLTLASLPSFAAEGVSYPWQMGFQDPASPVMERLVELHDYLLIMCIVISLFVLGLLVYIAFRFNEKRNPVPSKTTHNATIEVIWTVVPILILVAIVIPSWKLITYMDKAPNPEITVKAIGYQWYWGYEYMDGEGQGIEFESYMKLENTTDPSLQLQEGDYRNLSTDTKVVLPVDTDIRILTTAADVIHAWAIPAFGVKMDAVPGRINETWTRITKPGVYYGQCSELCGSKHAFMPIEVHAVSKEEYKAWVKEQGGKTSEDLAVEKAKELTTENNTNNKTDVVDELKSEVQKIGSAAKSDLVKENNKN